MRDTGRGKIEKIYFLREETMKEQIVNNRMQQINHSDETLFNFFKMINISDQFQDLKEKKSLFF